MTAMPGMVTPCLSLLRQRLRFGCLQLVDQKNKKYYITAVFSVQS